VVGAVDEDDPGSQVVQVAGLGLAERGGDHVRGVLADGPCQPLRPGAGALAEFAGAGPAAGRGDHVVRAGLGEDWVPRDQRRRLVSRVLGSRLRPARFQRLAAMIVLGVPVVPALNT
jgi:hypothetical protein